MKENEVIKINLCRILRFKLDEKKVMSKKQFAEELGVSAAIVSKWLSNVNAPDIEYIPNICRILNVSLEEIFMFDTDQKMTADEKEIIDKIRNDSFMNYVVHRIIFGDKYKTPEI